MLTATEQQMKKTIGDLGHILNDVKLSFEDRDNGSLIYQLQLLNSFSDDALGLAIVLKGEK